MRLVSVFPGARALLGGALGGFWWFLVVFGVGFWGLGKGSSLFF